MKTLLITLDGLGDRPAPEFEGRTALEAAHTPNLDSLAARAVNGLITAVAPGVPAGTPTAHALFLGYDLDELPGRAVFHSVARGVVPQPGEVVSLARFSSAEPETDRVRLVQRMMSAPEEESQALAEAIKTHSTDGVEIELVYTGNTEGLLILRGNVSDAFTDCDPLGEDLPVIKAQPMDHAADRAAADRTATAMNSYLRWAHTVLRDHPVNASRIERGELPMNFLLSKWAGRRMPLLSFEERFGMRAVSLTSEEILLGVMHELGVETRDDELPDTEQDLVNRLTLAKTLLAETYDFVHVHTKQPDVTAHLADPPKKVEAIEALDRGFKSLIEELLPDPELVICITSDHSTPSVVSGHLKRGRFHDQHAGEPVPIMVLGRNVLSDDVAVFSERAGAGGGLGLVRGKELMPILLSQAERTNVIGWRPTPRETLHRPSEVEPFRV